MASGSCSRQSAAVSIGSEPDGSKKGRVGLVYDERMMAHENPEGGHPEQPARLSSIYDQLVSDGLAARCVPVIARAATDEELEGVHTCEHVALMSSVSTVLNAEERDTLSETFNSIYFNEGSSLAALLAAGSLVELAAKVASGELEAGAAVIRPPGHHAESDKAMGFCLFNNVAVAANAILHQQPSFGVKRLLIVDWDVHHGNGIQNMFWEDPQVLYFSAHRHDDGYFYPRGDAGNYDQVGGGLGAGFNINVPWPSSGFGDADYLAAWDNVLLPVAREFNPDIVFVSAGFDAAMGDPLGGCCITPFGYSQLTHKLRELAEGRIVLALEGGYNLQSIAASYAACVSALLGDPPVTKWPSLSPPAASPAALKVISQVKEELAPFWSSLKLQLDCKMTLSEQAFDTKLTKELLSLSLTSARPSVSGLGMEQQESTLTQLSAQTSNLEADVMESSAFNVDLEKLDDEEVGDIAGVKTSFLTKGASSIIVEEVKGMRETYVWYASYGSNMLKERFMCYIVGGQVNGMASPCEGCRDKTPPLADQWLTVSHRMWFGRKKTATWGYGGVSFLDPEPTSHSSYVRLYKITLEQFNDVISQENRKSSNNQWGHHLQLPELYKLQMSAVDKERTLPTLHILPDAWYGRILYLGEKDGAPILTFTCSHKDISEFRVGSLPVNSPSSSYHAVITKGLVEEKGMSVEEAHDYISQRSKPLC